MEKGQESKQKRKTPLTTIAISQEYAQKLDEYLNGTGITRKEFVELSVDYFQRTGFDLRGEVFDLSPIGEGYRAVGTIRKDHGTSE